MGAQQSADLSSSPSSPQSPESPGSSENSSVPPLFPSPLPVLDGSHSGWRIFKLVADSPCSALGLIPYFDVLTHVNGVRLSSSEFALHDCIKEGVETELSIFSLCSRELRKVRVLPNRQWGGGTSGLLGLMIKFVEDFSFFDFECIHCLEVQPGSPAESAGIVAFQDFLLGTPSIGFRDWAQLDRWLSDAENTAGFHSVLVFNALRCSVREAWVKPKTNWGPNASGKLGCQMSMGYKHRLPIKENALVAFEMTSPPPQPVPAPMPPAPVTIGHGHSHGGQPCHGHGPEAQTPSQAPAFIPASAHAHSHGGDSHGHSHGPSPPATPALPKAQPQMRPPQPVSQSHPFSSTPMARQFQAQQGQYSTSGTVPRVSQPPQPVVQIPLTPAPAAAAPMPAYNASPLFPSNTPILDSNWNSQESFVGQGNFQAPAIFQQPAGEPQPQAAQQQNSQPQPHHTAQAQYQPQYQLQAQFPSHSQPPAFSQSFYSGAPEASENFQVPQPLDFS